MVIKRKRPTKRQYDEDEELDDDEDEELDDDEDEELYDDEDEELDDDEDEEKNSRVLITRWKKLKLQNKKLKTEIAKLQKNGETAKLTTLIRQILKEEEEAGQNSPRKRRNNGNTNGKKKPIQKQTSSRLFRKRQ